MTGIKELREWANELREAARAYRDGEIGYVPIDVEACQRKNAARLDAISDQIEREIEEAVADEVADTLSAYEMNTNVRWHSAVEEGEESDCKAEFELISRYWLPRPRFEDGEPVQFGDRFVANTGEVRQVARITCFDNGRFVLISEYGHRYIVGKEKADGERAKRPEPPKVLDADGVEIKVGDEVWGIDSGRHCKVFEVCETSIGVNFIDGRRGPIVSEIQAFNITHKRPEPEDSWGQIEADASDDIMVLDFVRRCKKLAGVE